MDNISFGNTFHFLQNQVGLTCANCGRMILAEKELNAMAKRIPELKGAVLAEFLSPFTDYFCNSVKREPLDRLISYASDEKFLKEGLKGLAFRFNIFHGNKPIDILRRLFDSVLYSADHIIPRSEGGVNRQANYLPMHRGCNSDRFSESYEVLAQRNPDFISNIEKSLKEIYRRIVADMSGKPKYKINLQPSYIEDVVESLKKQGVSVNADFIKSI